MVAFRTLVLRPAGYSSELETREIVPATDRRPADLFVTPHESAPGAPPGRYLAIDAAVVSTFTSHEGDRMFALLTARRESGRARSAGNSKMRLLEQQLDSIGCILGTVFWDFRPLAFDTYAVP